MRLDGLVSTHILGKNTKNISSLSILKIQLSSIKNEKENEQIKMIAMKNEDQILYENISQLLRLETKLITLH